MAAKKPKDDQEHRQHRDREGADAEQAAAATIGSAHATFPPQEDQPEDEADGDQATDPRIGPVRRLALLLRPTRNGPMAAVNSAAPT